MFTLPWSRKPVTHFPSLEELGFVELRGERSSVKIVPSLGGKIAELHLAGRQWLWTSDVLPWVAAADGASYAETGDTGGYDECFPTVAASRVPGWVKGYGGVELPDHGELWSQAPTLEIETTPQGQCAVTTWQGMKLPYRLTRIVRATPGGSVIIEYHATNDGSDRIPFIWAPQPMLPMTPQTRIVLPEGAPMRVASAHRVILGDHKSMHRWPFVRAGGKVFDFAAPFESAKEYACKLFLDLPGQEGWALLREGDLELEVTFATTEIGQFGLWLNKQGWTPFKKGKPYLNLSFGPCIGAPDTLSDALGDWKRAQWLEPGEVRSWSMTWRAKRVEGESV